MIWRYISIFLLFSLTLAQSIDEEEAVNIGNGAGSGNGVDDEDLTGSGLPPDEVYATTPSLIHPKLTTSKVETTNTKFRTSPTQAPKTWTPPRTTTHAVTTRPVDVTKGLWNNNSMILILVALIVLLVILIITVLVCRGCTNKRQTYRTDVKEPSASSLLQRNEYK